VQAYGQPPVQAYGQPAPAYGAPPMTTPAYGPPPGGYGAPVNPSAYGPAAAPAAFGYQAGPYAGRGYADAPAGTGAPTVHWFVAGSFAATILCSIIGGAIGAAAEGSEVGATISGLFSVLTIPLLLTYVVTALVWLYKSWEMVPHQLRVTGNGNPVTPGKAVGALFIPFYNLYWYFAVSAGLCNALNRALAGYGSPKRASSGLAIAAAVLQVIPYVNIALAPFLWIAFMFNVESAKREYARLAGTSRA
jgi:hypothetical protein